MSSARKADYWKSYRRVRANVHAHLAAIYHSNNEATDESLSINHSSDADIEIGSENVSVVGLDNTRNPCEEELHAQVENGDAFDYQEQPNALFGNDSDQELYVNDETETDNDSNIDVKIDIDSDNSLENELQTWASSFHIPHAALQSLLSILRVHHPFLPKDPRTLLRTCRRYNITAIDGGSYYHFGIASSLLKEFESRPNIRDLQLDSLQIQFNIDGVPLFKSTNTQFWPILGRVVRPFESSPFIVGLFSGNQKPGSAQEYLQYFREELDELFQNGINIPDSDHNLAIEVCCFVCDTPARNFVKQTKGHSGYYGCDRCTQRGVWSEKVTFPEVDAPLRTDVQFDEMQQEEHHKNMCPLAGLHIGLVSQFPLDYMHLVCLGVTRRLLMLWIKGPLICRQGTRFAIQVSDIINMLRPYMPRDFLRKGRSLQELDRWKASEFRQFLLYLGPVILRGLLPIRYYKHFMLLVVAIYCLSSPLFSQVYCGYAKELLSLFVSQVGQLYGNGQYVYNVHALVHLADDVSRYGALDNFSSFIYESFLGKIKKLVRKANFPLQQVIRRLSENCLNDVASKEKHIGTVQKQHRNGPVPHAYANYKQFEQMYSTNTVFFSVKDGNNCIFYRNCVGLIRNILSVSEDSLERVFIVENFRNMDNFFEEPLPSSDLHIFKLSRLSQETVAIHVNEVKSKCILLPYRNKFVSIPLIHSHLYF